MNKRGFFRSFLLGSLIGALVIIAVQAIFRTEDFVRVWPFWAGYILTLLVIVYLSRNEPSNS